MLTIIPDLLSTTELDAVRSLLRRGNYVDGKISAGEHARRNKTNQELAPDPDSFDALNNVVMTRLVQHPLYLQAAMPARIAAPVYARYTEGMGYGEHIDDALMGAPGSRYRSDISISIFLSDPDKYQDGELCIESDYGIREFKLPAGQALLYPSSSIHSVKPLGSGERLVAVTWVQSHIRRADQRQVLVQLDQARQAFGDESPDSAHRLIDNCYANLFRMWADV